MKDEMKEQILNQLDPIKVGEAFTSFVVSQTPNDDLMGYMESFRQKFRPFILKKLKEKSLPVVDGDEIVKQHKGNEIKRELEQASTRVMLDLEQMIEKMKLQKNDWLEIFSEIV
jgi:hypothetical protein